MIENYLNEDALETITINIPERAPIPFGSVKFDHLPTDSDLCRHALEWAMQLLGFPDISSDLNVSPQLAQDGWAQELLDKLPQDWYLNRLRIRSFLRPHEWYIEVADGRTMGSSPPG